MRFNTAFSLIELLVVVAIVAILAGIALPTYQINTTQVKLSRIIPTLDNLTKNLMVQYNENGAMPAAFNGISGDSGGGYGTFMIPHETSFIHYVDGSTWANTGAFIQVSIPQDIGAAIPGFVASTNGSDGANNSLLMALYEDNGTFKIYCGTWDNSSIYIPVDYLPPGCNTVNLSPIVSGN